MKLAIVGSAVLSSEQEVAAAYVIYPIIYYYSDDINFTVVSGGSVGVDSLAEELAGAHSIPTIIHLPEVKRWEDRGGKVGFKSRNVLIAKDCDELLCIRSRTSTTYGSGWTADVAESLGKRVVRVYV